ncbi:MAG TPA: hypothetical protein VNE62_06615 [Actinomycetota bacterium]|nr:hypothetical protein [Actinomycetota bacterium]
MGAAIAIAASAAVGAGAQENKDVAIADSVFKPGKVELSAPGGTVTWRYEVGAAATHTVTSQPATAETFKSPRMGPGPTSNSFTHTFGKAGTFTYYCEIHGTPNGAPEAGTCGMCGTVVVRGQSGGGGGGGGGPSATARIGTPTPRVTPTATPRKSSGPLRPGQTPEIALPPLETPSVTPELAGPSPSPTQGAAQARSAPGGGGGSGRAAAIGLAFVSVAGAGALAWTRLRGPSGGA